MFSLVHQTVADFNAWKNAYDSIEQARQAGGVTSSKVLQSQHNPNEAFILLEWSDADKAKAYFASDALKEAMNKGGAQGTPDVWYVDET